ncbi:uncharacterized protein PRCAT00003415001 [Priceomyces carsonii]|uniref:uncharacterized protein n=1 Tax=Priceomyces carsonii TaxID=28549 RepID=UPI002ED98347|nr:unnamed protein product [Priceomyces carsonii]
MGKLVFKGDKPQKKKRKVKTEDEVINRDSEEEHKSLENATGWITSNSLNDLTGPCILLLVSDDKNGKIITFNPDLDCFELTKRYDIVRNPYEFSETQIGDYPEYHMAEPSVSTQVFIISSISAASKTLPESVGARKGIAKSFSLKANTQYFSASQTTWEPSISPTVSDLSLFQFTPHTKTNEKFGLGETFWTITILNGKRTLVNQEGRLVFAPTVDVSEKDLDKFLVRIQIKNLQKYKKFLLAQEEEKGNDIKQILKDLYKETKGKIKITDDLVKRLKDSIKSGNLNEQLLEEKSRISSRW